MKKLYYEKENGEFYWVKQTSKTISVEWIKQINCDGSELDQNVRWKNLKVKKVQTHTGGHPIRQNDEDGILIYPFQGGVPFFLEPATKTHITNEISDCVKWGVSSQYYQDLIKEATHE